MMATRRIRAPLKWLTGQEAMPAASPPPLLPLGVHELHLTALVPVQPRLVTSETILARTK